MCGPCVCCLWPWVAWVTRLLFIAPASSKHLKSFKPKVCRKVCVPVMFSDESEVSKARLPACVPLLASRAREVSSGEGHRSFPRPAGLQAPWPRPQHSFRSYDSRHIWTICIELVWELFAALPPLFGFVHCFFGMRVV